MYYNSFSPIYNSTLGNEFDTFDDLIDYAKSMNTYQEIFQISNAFRTKIVFSCIELKDNEIHSICQASPENLMKEIKDFSKDYSVSIIAENSESLNSENVEQKLKVISANLPGFYEFTYMRMNDFDLEDPLGEVKMRIVNTVSQEESTNYYEEEEMHWIEIEMTFTNEEDMKKALLELNQYMII